MNRPIWIMTRRAGYNYGSSLQAYALQRVVREMGYDNLIVDYAEYRLRGRLRLALLRLAARSFALLPRPLRSARMEALIGFDRQRRGFDRFEAEWLEVTPRRYRNDDRLRADSRACRVCICGSDQIWSPLLFDPAFFLSFVDPASTRTVSYAPSIGVERIDSHRKEMARLIARIEHLSVRERRGAELIRQLTGREAEVVLDPTLLLDAAAWSSLAVEPGESEPYILCYFLAGERVPLAFVEKLQRRTGYKIINLQTNYFRFAIPGADNRASVSPRQFVGLVERAAFVCTNSFHGTIFSTLFERPFYLFRRFGAGESSNQNSRIDTLLTSIGLQDRLVADPQAEPGDAQIDFRKVRERLEALRSRSLEFLQRSLSLD